MDLSYPRTSHKGRAVYATVRKLFHQNSTQSNIEISDIYVRKLEILILLTYIEQGQEIAITPND